MKSIWYFVGLILMVIGFVVLSSGVYYYYNPNEHKTILSELHPSIWWGGIMIFFGLIYFLTNNRTTVE